MDNKYTSERNAQILIYLLKQNGIKKVIASPGTTNVAFVASIQQDPFFEIYSAPDERSAGYIACGMSEESHEPVVLSCTGATASRNYYPGMTEAFYRKLPIIAITSSRQGFYIGHNNDQVTDRTVLPNDVANLSVQLPLVHDIDSEWACIIRTNKALHAIKRHGGGPVHINLETNYNADFSVQVIPPVRMIEYYANNDTLPKIESNEIGIIIGSHSCWTYKQVQEIEEFCEKYNGVVICDHISNYPGKYKINATLASIQYKYKSDITKIKHILHIGGITSSTYRISPDILWRVNPDGEIRDTYRKLKAVFEMDESFFFKSYCGYKDKKCDMSLYKRLKEEETMILSSVPELPFSNAWIAKNYANRFSDESVVHLGIRNSLRVWTFFNIDESVRCYSNVGGFGIDGCLSSLIGASLVNKDKVYYCILGDLAFFYDMNSLGNRHVANNIRILLVNNATGMEMKFTDFYASRIGTEIDEYISASHHYGNKSRTLVKEYAMNLGFTYFAATNKEEFKKHAEVFFSKQKSDKPLLFEVFVDSNNEDEAMQIMVNSATSVSGEIKSSIKKVIGKNTSENLKKFFTH